MDSFSDMGSNTDKIPAIFCSTVGEGNSSLLCTGNTSDIGFCLIHAIFIQCAEKSHDDGSAGGSQQVLPETNEDEMEKRFVFFCDCTDFCGAAYVDSLSGSVIYHGRICKSHAFFRYDGQCCIVLQQFD